ncbi:MAG TPA: CcmD family protein [Cryomorphaceae bacterium]|jgi:CcmD family protein|nr:CcmD family protein [Cryomorphaceae bacterium]
MKKQIALMSVLSPLAAAAQNDSIMYGNDKMNVVIGVITIIFIGIGAYLFSLDRKIKKLEDEK